MTNGCYDDSISANTLISADYLVWGAADSLDEPDEVVTLTFTDDPDNPRPAGVAQINVSSTVTIRDDDPTIVSLARVGSGAVDEGDKVEFTVTLGRALIAGETIDVPLSIGGTGVTTGDWSLALESSATNTGVTLSDTSTTTPKVSFSGASAQTATLELTATADGATENAETFEIALGANSAFDDANLDTNVGGGADPHGTSTNNAFDVTVNNANDAPNPVISVSLPISEGESRSDAGEKKVDEGDGGVGIGFNLAADRPLASALTVCVRVTESGGDRVASGSEGIQTANMPSSVTNGSGTHTLTWTNNTADDQDSSVTVEVVAPNTASCSAANDSYTVSSSDASDKLLIQDDEDTTVSLTASSDTTMTEGDATDTAVLTISLDRRLYAGETIGVPIALASTTGARLPGSTDSGTANHDFTVAAAAASMHTGVTLTNALSANPRVVFTGHDTNTVQTATVTLTPVANRDDGDAAHETITATLASLGLLETTVNGGVTAHGTNNAATLSLEDDEAAPPATTCPAQNGIFSEPSLRLRILETGETTYCVRLTRPPSGGDTTVTIGTTGSYTGAATASPTTLTFTASNYQTPQQVTVTGVDQTSLHLNRTLSLTHTANGGNYTNWSLGTVMVEVDDAPELEAWDLAVWNANDFAAKQRPNTVKATRGFRYFQNDMTPIYPLRYQLRLSNRPATGETVTVTATSSDPSKFGLSLTSGGTPQASLTVTFEDRPADRVCFNGGHSSLFDVNTSNPDASWACYRQTGLVFSPPGERREVISGLVISFSMWQCAGHGDAAGPGFVH